MNLFRLLPQRRSFKGLLKSSHGLIIPVTEETAQNYKPLNGPFRGWGLLINTVAIREHCTRPVVSVRNTLLRGIFNLWGWVADSLAFCSLPEHIEERLVKESLAPPILIALPQGLKLISYNFIRVGPCLSPFLVVSCLLSIIFMLGFSVEFLPFLYFILEFFFLLESTLSTIPHRSPSSINLYSLLSLAFITLDEETPSLSFTVKISILFMGFEICYFILALIWILLQTFFPFEIAERRTRDYQGPLPCHLDTWRWRLSVGSWG